jgi:ATP/maltotriose-dependent transcriptional regulator MalT
MTIPEGFCEQYDISQRELDVMNLLLQGYRYKDIGGKLFISLATVKTHILHIYSKMDVLDKGEFLEKIRKNPIP